MAPRSCSAYDSGHTPGNHLGRWAKPGEGCCGGHLHSMGDASPYRRRLEQRSRQKISPKGQWRRRCDSKVRDTQDTSSARRSHRLSPWNGTGDPPTYYPRKLWTKTIAETTRTALMGGVEELRLSRSVGRPMCGRWHLTVIRQLSGMVMSAGR